MRQLRLLIGVMVLLGGLVAAGCASDSEGGTEEPTDEAQPDDSGSGSTATTIDFECPEPSTTTASTTSTSGLSICAAIERIPPDEQLPPEDRENYVVWSGTITGSIQTPSCQPVSQAGRMLIIVFADGGLAGAGETETGAYTCDNGASIPASLHSYGVDGEKTDVFTLVFTDGVTLSSGPIEDGHAVFVQDTGAGLVTIELTCEQNC